MKLREIIQKTSMAVFGTLMLSYSPQLVNAQGNLIVNSGFDTDTSGWNLTNVSVLVGGGYSSSVGNPPGSVILYNAFLQNVPTASQEIGSLTPGTLYVVSGDYQRIAGKNVTDNSFGVALDGVFLFETIVPKNSNWYSFSFNYTATSTSALLSLEAQINGKDYSYAIDNIAMYAVPEPSSFCLIGVGGAVGFLFFWQRRQNNRRVLVGAD